MRVARDINEEVNRDEHRDKSFTMIVWILLRGMGVTIARTCTPVSNLMTMLFLIPVIPFISCRILLYRISIVSTLF